MYLLRKEYQTINFAKLGGSIIGLEYIYEIREEHELTVRKELVNEYNYSSRLIREIKREGKISLNNKACFLGDYINKGDCVKITMPHENIDGISVFGELDVVYEDEEILVVNKPPFCVTHPSKSHQMDTLSNYISYYWEKSNFSGKIRFINRLDRDTTGLVAIAKNKYVHHYVQKQMNENKVEKIYHAFVHGKLPQNSGTINEPIGQEYEDSIQRSVTEKGKPSITHYQVIKEYDNASLVELKLETGRTHQIRVHMYYIGNPIIGDPLYHRDHQNNYGMERQALHAISLSLSVPSKGNLNLEASYYNDLDKLRENLEYYEEKKVVK